MRDAYNNRDLVKEKGIKARIKIENNYGYDKVGPKLIQSF
jgi:hypothetical protein